MGDSETTPSEYLTSNFYYGKILLFSLARSICERGVEMVTSPERIGGKVQAANWPEARRTSPRRNAMGALWSTLPSFTISGGEAAKCIEYFTTLLRSFRSIGLRAH